jgi:hypothetical protein
MKMGRLSDRSLSLWIVGILLLTSCDFHVNNRTGPQYSWSVAQSKDNRSFICEYRLNNSIINGVDIKNVVAEHAYSSDGGLFSKYDIDCCNSQIVIVSKSYLASDGRGYSVDWDISGFKVYSSNIIYRELKGVNLPDSITLFVRSKKNNSVLQTLTLHKVVNNK